MSIDVTSNYPFSLPVSAYPTPEFHLFFLCSPSHNVSSFPFSSFVCRLLNLSGAIMFKSVFFLIAFEAARIFFFHVACFVFFLKGLFQSSLHFYFFPCHSPLLFPVFIFPSPLNTLLCGSPSVFGSYPVFGFTFSLFLLYFVKFCCLALRFALFGIFKIFA